MNASGRSPAVSVVTCFLNEERFLKEAVESVLEQTYEDWELLLVDDGSTDGSGEIAASLAKNFPQKIRCLQHDGGRNRGLSASRNLGIAHSRGELISFLDADDVWVADKLAHQVGLLEREPKIGMVCGASVYWNSWHASEKPDKRVKVGCPQNCAFEPPELMELLYPLGKGAAPSMNSLLVKRSVIRELNGFVEEFANMYEDQVFLSKVYFSQTVYVSDQVSDYYRIRPSSICSTVERSGSYAIYRRRFLYWLQRYMKESRIRDRRIARSLAAAIDKLDVAEGGRTTVFKKLRSRLRSKLDLAFGGGEPRR